jgi:hypothetical protein
MAGMRKRIFPRRGMALAHSSGECSIFDFCNNYGTQLPRTCATARPQLAKADTAFQAHPLVNRLNFA